MGVLRALTRLRRLGLTGTSVKDGGLALVAPLAALRSLSLDRCHRLTDAGARPGPTDLMPQPAPSRERMGPSR